MLNLDFTTDVVQVVFDISGPECERVPGRTYKKYKFRVPKAMIGTIGVGDKVVVCCRDGSFSCATVSDVNVRFPQQDEQPLAFVVDVINTTALDEHKQREASIAELRTRLEARKQAFEQNAIYEMLAEKDSEAAEMLKMLKQLGGEL